MRNYFFPPCTNQNLTAENNTPRPAALTLQPRALRLKCLIKQTNPSGVNHLLIYSARKEELKDERWQETRVSFQ